MVQASNDMKSILVIKDEPTISQVCARILRAEGFAVDIVSNGKAALDVLTKKKYDLCLVDIRTPEMNGIELYRYLEKDYPESLNKLIFTTGDVLSSTIKVFLEETSRPFLPKPFTPDQLRVIVGAVMDLNQVVLSKQRVEEWMEASV